MKQQKLEPPALDHPTRQTTSGEDPGAGGMTATEEQRNVTEASQPRLPGFEDTARDDPGPPSIPPAGGSALSQLQTENAELRAAIRFADARASLTTELGKSGARSPELLFEAIKGDVQFDDEGRPVNIAALIDRLRRQYPEQFAPQFAPSIDAGAGQTPAPKLTRDALSRMKPSEIAELDWAEVRRVLANA